MLKKIFIGLLVAFGLLAGVSQLVSATTVQVTDADGSTSTLPKSAVTSVSPNVSIDEATGEPLITTGVALTEPDVEQLARWIIRQPGYADVCAIAASDQSLVLEYLASDVTTGVEGNQNTISDAALSSGVRTALQQKCG